MIFRKSSTYKLIIFLTTIIAMTGVSCGKSDISQSASMNSSYDSLDVISGNNVSANNISNDAVIMDFSGTVKIDRDGVGGVRVFKNMSMLDGDSFVTYAGANGIICIGGNSEVNSMANTQAISKVAISESSLVKIIESNESGKIVKLIYGEAIFDLDIIDNHITIKTPNVELSTINLADNLGADDKTSSMCRVKVSYDPHYEKTNVEVINGEIEVVYNNISESVQDKAVHSYSRNCTSDEDFDRNSNIVVYRDSVDLYINDKNHFIKEFKVNDGYDMAAVLDDQSKTDLIEIYKNNELFCVIESPITFAVGHTGEITFEEETERFILTEYESTSGRFAYSGFVSLIKKDIASENQNISENAAKKKKAELKDGFYIRPANYNGSRTDIIQKYREIMENVIPDLDSYEIMSE